MFHVHLSFHKVIMMSYMSIVSQDSSQTCRPASLRRILAGQEYEKVPANNVLFARNAPANNLFQIWEKIIWKQSHFFCNFGTLKMFAVMCGNPSVTVADILQNRRTQCKQYEHSSQIVKHTQDNCVVGALWSIRNSYFSLSFILFYKLF